MRSNDKNKNITKNSEDSATDISVSPETPRKKRRKLWIIPLVIILVVAAILVVPRLLKFRQVATDTGEYISYSVTRNDITVTLSGSGTLQPADSYTITSLISGDILSASFEEGDYVEKDAVLYTVDSSDIHNSIEQSENNLDRVQNTYNNALNQRDDLNLKANGTGTVTQLTVELGDTVTQGQTVAFIRDSETMSITVLYQRDFALSLSVGGSATIGFGGSFETYSGVISSISPTDTILDGNAIVREVTVDVTNPGAFTPSSTAYVIINGISGIDNGTFAYKYEGSVVASASGTVTSINTAESSPVTKNQTIIVLQSDSLDQSIENAYISVEDAQLALDNQRTQLDDYEIRSPISGIIVEKDSKAGDTLKAGEKLCTVFDLSHLTLVLNVDELDIKKIESGQSVTITADASQGVDYTGIVTKININGTTQNGVTSYPVTIQLDQTEGLLPGMNVDAIIVVEALNNVVTVPVNAVLRGSFVLLKTGDESQISDDPAIPAGFSHVQVTLGSSNDTDIVITSGLKPGDIIAVLDNTPSSYNSDSFFMESRNRPVGNGSTVIAPAGGNGSTAKAPAGDAG